jgi:hypothetical protein
MRKLIILAGVSIAGVALAACGSSTTSGTQVFAGSTTNVSQNAKVPITGSGVVTSTSGTLPGGSGSKAVLKFNNGTVDVTHSKGNNGGNGTVSMDSAKCTLTDVVTGTYTVTGGTGSYSGATGHGTYKITFLGRYALTGGKCSPTPSANPISGLEVFHASGPLTVG